MGCNLPFPTGKYQLILADPPWAYRQQGGPNGKRGMASAHYATMSTAEIAALPVRDLCLPGAVCLLWATLPNIMEAVKVLEAWGFKYKTAAFVWVKKNRKSGGLFWGMGAYTRANAELCLIGVSRGGKAKNLVKSHRVHQIIEAPEQGHSRKPPEVRDKLVELFGDVPRLELFARERAPGWDAWGEELPNEP